MSAPKCYFRILPATLILIFLCAIILVVQAAYADQCKRDCAAEKRISQKAARSVAKA